MALDKLTVFSFVLFVFADLFSICSLFTAKWVVSSKDVHTEVGLLSTCIRVIDHPPSCYTPSPLPLEWLATFALIVIGASSLAVTLILIIVGHWTNKVTDIARCLGFVALIVFCLAAVIFPIGFTMKEVGGQAFLLPTNFQIGISYILFIMALWFTFISELFLGKVCLPHL